MAELAPLRIVYIFEDGAESDMALGTITRDGILETTKVAQGQEDAVATLVAELNGSDRVFVRDAQTSPETGRAAMVKTPVPRGMPGFLDALRDTAKRFYKVDLRFDPAVFAGGELLMMDPDAGGGDDDDDAGDQIDDTPPGPDMTPVKDPVSGFNG